jgi:uncharacterized membrane-anchored protein YitT (DUF2179 family)
VIRNPYIEREARYVALILLGVLSAGFGIEGFLVPGGFIDGGVTGVSMLLGHLTPIPLPVWLPLINIPFLAVGYRQLGLAFAVRGALAIGALALALVVVPYPHVTEDHVLEAVFGGFFLGAGIGFAVRGAAVLDGTEIAALLISKRSHVLKVGDVILLFNVVLFLVAMRTLGVESALYSILTFLAAAKTLDFVIYGLEEFTAVTIFSREHAAIRDGIIRELGRGVSVLRGYGGLSGQDQDVLYCVVTRLEVGRVKQIVRARDAGAFVVYHTLSDVDGGVVKRSIRH